MHSIKSNNARTFQPRQFASGLLLAAIGLAVIVHMGMDAFNGNAAHLTMPMMIAGICCGVALIGMGFGKLVAASPGFGTGDEGHDVSDADN